jgi:predicted porin
MKRTTLALALTAGLSTFAHAQSSVTIAGTVDGGIRYQTNADAARNSKTSIGSNGYYSSNKLDFLGSEDLGSGMRASFVLESGFNLGTGQLDNTTNILFNRQAFVQFDSVAGALSIGRQYTISHDFILVYDPFGFHYTPLIPLTRASSGTRFNNDVKYVKNFGPVKLEIENSFGEVADSPRKNAAHGVGLQYEGGNLTFGGVINRRSILVGTVYHDDNYYLIGAAWQAGALKISGGTMLDEVVNTAPLVNAKTRDSFGGVSYQVTSAFNATIGHYVTQAPSDKALRRALTIIGLDYALSKRTKLYLEADYTRYHTAIVSTINTAGAPQQTAFTAGINHRF